MIKGIHGMFYSDEADELRAFFRDKLQLPFSDVGHGWLIFDLPEGDLGVHPTGSDDSEPANTHSVSFYCDDVEATVAELKGRGVIFDGGIRDEGFGLVALMEAPGGLKIQLYEPRYTKG